MRFVVDADLPRSTKRLLEEHGHQAVDVRDIGLGEAKDAMIAQCALEQEAVLLTGDFGFADIRNYPPDNYHGIVVLELPPEADAPLILRLIDGFLRQESVLGRLAGRLAIVSASRIRVRSA